MPDVGDVAVIGGLNLVQDVLNRQNDIMRKVHNHNFTLEELAGLNAHELSIVSIMRLQDITKSLDEFRKAYQTQISQWGEKWIPFDLAVADNFSLTLKYDVTQRVSLINTAASASDLHVLLPGGGASFTITPGTGSWSKLNYPPGTRIFNNSGDTYAKGIIHYGVEYLGS